MANSKPTIAITGAGGFLGSALVGYFTARRWRVIGLVRNPQRYSQVQAIEYRAYDLLKPVDTAVLSDVDYLVHGSYIKSPNLSDSIDPNVQGTEQLLKACETAGVKKLIFLSSMSARADATSNYGKQKFAIEKLLQKSRDVALRPGLVIGDGGVAYGMAQFMQRFHVVPLVGTGRQPVQVVRADEVAVAVEAAILKNVHGTFTIATDQSYTYRQFYTELAEHVGTRILFIRVPFFLLLNATRMVKLLHLPINVSEDSVLGLRKLASVDTSADLEALGLHIDDLETSLTRLSFQDKHVPIPKVKV